MKESKHKNLRECHEEAAGMGLDDLFFAVSKIDPDGECVCLESLKKGVGK